MQFDFKRMLKYEYNVGDKDQKIRYSAGSFAILLSMFLGSVPLLLLGIALLVSGYTHFCPIYAGLGKTTVDPNGQKACCAGEAGQKVQSPSCCGHEHETHSS